MKLSIKIYSKLLLVHLSSVNSFLIDTTDRRRIFDWISSQWHFQVQIKIILLPAECPQCNCGETRQMLTFLINLYCPRSYYRHYHSIRIVEYHCKIINIINPKPNIFTETRTQGSFRVCDLSSCNLLAETNNSVLCAILLLCLVSDQQKSYSTGLEPRTVFRGCGLCFCNLIAETNNFGLGTVLLSCLVSVLQEPPSPGFELGTSFRSFYAPIFSSWSQGISMPSLVQIGLSHLEL
jgi:hypothetical protein